MDGANNLSPMLLWAMRMCCIFVPASEKRETDGQRAASCDSCRVAKLWLVLCSLSKFARSHLSMCIPQPFQVGFEQVSQLTFRHMIFEPVVRTKNSFVSS